MPPEDQDVRFDAWLATFGRYVPLTWAHAYAGCSRSWIWRQVRRGRLTVYEFEADGFTARLVLASDLRIMRRRKVAPVKVLRGRTKIVP